MTDLRKAAEKALYALEDPNRDKHIANTNDAINSLRQALAQPEQEPVAWAVLRPDGRVKLLSHQQGVEVDLKWTPLYTKEKA